MVLTLDLHPSQKGQDVAQGVYSGVSKNKLRAFGLLPVYLLSWFLFTVCRFNESHVSKARDRKAMWNPRFCKYTEQ